MIQKTCVTLFRIICRLQLKKLGDGQIAPCNPPSPTHPWFPRVLRAACSNGHLNFCRIEINRFSLPFSERRLLLTLKLLAFLFSCQDGLTPLPCPEKSKTRPQNYTSYDFSERFLWILTFITLDCHEKLFLELFQAVIYILSLKKSKNECGVLSDTMFLSAWNWNCSISYQIAS